MGKVFVTRRIPERGIELLQRSGVVSELRIYEEDRVIPRDELLASVAGVDAVLAILTERIDGAFLDAAGPQLKVVANMAVGYDNVDVAAATARGVIITNTPGVLTETTADLAFALILAACRRLSESEHYLRSGAWKFWSPTLLLGVDIHGQTLGLFGMGRIGQAVARRAKGFGMRILYCNRTRLDAAEEQALGVNYVDKATLLRESDIVSLHCPLTPETRGAFGLAEFRQMKPTAVFVNTTRGPVVKEAELAAALRDGVIFAAGLDVYENEPQIHPELLACTNTVLAPHIGSATQDTRGKMAAIAASNIVAVLKGEAPLNAVNPDVLAGR
ncbi:MAG: D-glycerate dehydrogenase [Candidatus Hydrogenedentes bacterium]|nr:D-glycerate dehydrogenase [Candidatus Hydrogenedentota bacterium]